MSATGQFWGTFFLPPIPPYTNPTVVGQFLLNIDSNRSHQGAGCFIYSIDPSNSPFNDATQFVISMRITQNDGLRFVATSASTHKLSTTGGIIDAPITPRNSIPYSVTVDLRANGPKRDSFSGTWVNSWGDQGPVAFSKTENGERVTDIHSCKGWSDYKAWASNEGRRHFAFRGQADSSWQLKTSLHRANRFDLWHYSTKVLPQLQQELEGGADTEFDRSKPTDFARLIALAQHHGFPTPLLDFTFSPYVAAYFALSGVLELPESKRPPYVRVFALDNAFREAAEKPLVTLTSIEPTAGIVGVSGLRNPRLYAQQGLFVLTNVELVEHLLSTRYFTNGKTFLRAVDIPSVAASEAINDLFYMGISPASLFGGIDGICTKLKQKLWMGSL